MKKTCATCGVAKDIDEFYKDRKKKNGYTYSCKECKPRLPSYLRNENKSSIKTIEYANKRRKRNKETKLLREYGISKEDYDKLFKEQNGQCAVCKVIATVLDVDHCHNTGIVRGLLCGNCNRGLGLLRDDPKIIKNLLEYISTERKVSNELFSMLEHLSRIK